MVNSSRTTNCLSESDISTILGLRFVKAMVSPQVNFLPVPGCCKKTHCWVHVLSWLLSSTDKSNRPLLVCIVYTQTLPLHTNHTAGAGFHHPCSDLLLAQLAASLPLFHIEVLRYCQDLADLLKLQPRSFVWSTEYYPMTKVTLRAFFFFLVS